MKVCDVDRMYDRMEITQCNYDNMLKRLLRKKQFSNFVITYYSIALIIYSLTAEFFSEQFNEKLSSYFNIILSIVVLTYSLIITNANYSERIDSARSVLNQIKMKKRELTEKNIEEIRSGYDQIMLKAEYRSDIDFFRTLKQRCKKNDVNWFLHKKQLKELRCCNAEEADKLNEYLSDNFPLTQQIIIVFQGIWSGMIIFIPIILFSICFY